MIIKVSKYQSIKESKISVSVLFLMATVLFLAGCHTLNNPPIIINASHQPPAQQSVIQQEKYGLNLAVVPFAEKRGNLKSYGSVYRYLIPLVPYGTMRYERPDQAQMLNTQNEFEFNMNENLVKIIIDSARKSGLFNNIILTSTPLESKADLILSGEIYSTLYEGKTYSYGISFLGPVLWCFGLPAGSAHKKINIRLYLKKIDSTEPIWSYNLDKENTVIQGLYHNWGKDVNSFVGLMEAGSKEAIEDMRVKISGIPLEKLKVKQPDLPAPTPTPPSKAEVPAPVLPEQTAEPILTKEIPATPASVTPSPDTSKQ